MLKSIDRLKETAAFALEDAFGLKIKVLTVSLHETEVRGLALCPGKVVRYVFESRTKQLSFEELLSVR